MSRYVVVDGSNIATEGRQHPSLAQLNEAVIAFMAEHPDSLITVVVDATFGHRIDPAEVPEFDDAVANNELVAPPAGAIGKGDAFVLSIANKVNATILSNDSFQEFHGEYAWLFDEGRLIGGKPVPHIGWVFVARTPVRGPKSRDSVKQAKRKRDGVADTSSVRVGSPEASRPMPVPKAPPPGRARQLEPVAAAAKADDKRSGRQGSKQSSRRQPEAAVATPREQTPREPASRDQVVNDLATFFSFVERHPKGTSVNAVVESYSSHGAYVRIGDVKGYVPLRLMADPAPRSAREFMRIGDAVTLVVDSFAPVRRSIDLAVVGMESEASEAPPVAGGRTARTPKATKEAAPTKDAAAKPTKAAKEPKAAKAEKPAKADRTVKADKPDKADKAGRPDKGGKVETAAKGAKSDKAAKPAKADKTDKVDKAPKAVKTDKTDKAPKPTRSAKVAGPADVVEAPKAATPVRAGGRRSAATPAAVAQPAAPVEAVAKRTRATPAVAPVQPAAEVAKAARGARPVKAVTAPVAAPAPRGRAPRAAAPAAPVAPAPVAAASSRTPRRAAPAPSPAPAPARPARKKAAPAAAAVPAAAPPATESSAATPAPRRRRIR